MRSPDPSAPGTPPPGLVSAVSKLLRPLVRLMVSYQLTYPQLSAILKRIYVDVAEDDFEVDGKRQSDSRINLLTGVHRKDVKRLRAEARDPINLPNAVSTGARIIGYWLGDRRYLDASGDPRPLALKAQGNADQSEFDQLVEAVCHGDIRPRVILDEWLRLGIAEVRDNSVSLNTDSFTPDKGLDEKAHFFGKNIQDHIAAGSHNLLGQKPAHFDRSVYYDQLSDESVVELSALANDLGMRALKEMNRQALALQKQDRAKQTATNRINFGIFNYNAKQGQSEGSDEQT